MLIRKVKNNIHNKYILITSILFICFILIIFNFFPQDFHYFIYALITIVYAITISIIIKNIENSQQNKEYQPMHFDVIFNKTTLIKNIKYKEIYDFSTLLPQNAPNTHISITILSAPISVEINHIKTRSKKYRRSTVFFINSFTHVFSQIISIKIGNSLFN